LPALLVIAAFRLRNAFEIPSFWKSVGTWMFGYFALFTSSLIIWGALSAPNTVYRLTRLNVTELLLLTLFMGLTLLLSNTQRWWQSHWHTVVLLLPIVGFLLAFFTRLLPFDVFFEAVKEDHIVEYAQFWVLFLGSIGCAWHGWTAVKLRQPVLALFFSICTLGLFFVAGDEISWGQRIFGIESSQAITQVNAQNETTVHNLYAVQWAVIYGYIALSLFGSYGAVITWYIRPLRKLHHLVPEKILIGYFLFSLIFFTAQGIVLGGIWHKWAEIAELYLYTGLVLWLILLGKHLLPQRHDR
jgi:hypothetical protein